ncbi:MAG: flagellar basal body-associated FliL family protein [Deltaproteobacteria bacterium]|nr:flagellar basal body-associated FliL family protein [Deltaproteobacteria bacterium]
MAEKETKIDLINLNSGKDPKGVASAGKGDAASPAEAIDKAGKGKSKKFIFIAVILGFVILAGAIGAAGYLGYLSIPGISGANPPEPTPSKKPEMGETLKFSPLIINMNEENGRHYLKTTIVLELDEKKWAEKIQSRMSVFTDAVILIVSEKRLEDMKANDFKERLKEELLNSFNGHLGQKGIRRVYFDEFLFQ